MIPPGDPLGLQALMDSNCLNAIFPLSWLLLLGRKFFRASFFFFCLFVAVLWFELKALPLEPHLQPQRLYLFYFSFEYMSRLFQFSSLQIWGFLNWHCKQWAILSAQLYPVSALHSCWPQSESWLCWKREEEADMSDILPLLPLIP
jgi:hypothetical protein